MSDLWYKTSERGDAVNLAHACNVTLYTPANQKYMPARADGEQTWAVEVQWPTNGEYGKATQFIFWGNPEQCRTEHARIVEMLTNDEAA